MRTFTIDAENNITVHPSKKAAKETGAEAFATEDQFAELIGSDSKRLVAIWNSLAGVTPVKKFKDSKTGVVRIWKQIQTLGEAGEPENPVPEPVAAEAIPEVPPQEPIAVPVPEEPIAPVVPEAPVQEPETQSAPPVQSEPVAEGGAPAPDIATKAESPTQEATPAKKARKAPKAARATKAANAGHQSGPREGSKTAQVVEMLKREGGATISEIMTTMGWQKHTVRGFMAGTMKKAGYTVESFKPEGGERSYRINK